VLETEKKNINVKRVVRSQMHGNSGVTYPFCVVKINSKKKLLLKKNATISSGFLYKQCNTRIGI
jgi:hypothetical protein